MEKFVAARVLIGRVGKAMTLLGAYALLASAILICVDIFLRRFFATSVSGSDELSGYALSVGTAWAFGAAFLAKSHIRIDFVRQFVSPRMQARMDVFASLMLFLVAALLCYYSGQVLAESIRYQSVANTPLRVPLWIPQSIWVSGLLFFAMSTGIATLEAFFRLISGDDEGVREIVGMPGQGQEV